MITLAFGVLGLHRIMAAIGPDNAPSIAVVRRLGFSRRGVCAITCSPTGVAVLRVVLDLDTRVESSLTHPQPPAPAHRGRDEAGLAE